MELQYLPLRIEPRSAFATPLKGDTLFGQLCWALRDRLGEDALRKLLQGYTDEKPFAVVSDALPECCWPRPVLPQTLLGDANPMERKAGKKRAWLRHDHFTQPVGKWLSRMVEDPGDANCERSPGDADQAPHDSPIERETRFRNSIDRRSGTTTAEGFAPYGVEQFWYRDGARLDCHIVYDTERIDGSLLVQAMADIGRFGFGRDATIGLGRFEVEECDHRGRAALPLSQADATSWLTLAPVAPQGMAWNPKRCWYRPFTRFGRHGNSAVHQGNPFKAPVLLADTGAVLTPRGDFEPRLFIGQGLGGAAQPVSLSIPETVHQGYAPVIGVGVPEAAGHEESSA